MSVLQYFVIRLDQQALRLRVMPVVFEKSVMTLATYVLQEAPLNSQLPGGHAGIFFLRIRFARVEGVGDKDT